jgi:predicted ATPase/transcriptional regulator with XRE-family HTH domain
MMMPDGLGPKASRLNLRLRAAREHLNMSYQDLADAIGLPDPHTAGRWERGENMPRAHYRRELCKLFGKSAEELGLIPQAQDSAAQAQGPVRSTSDAFPPSPLEDEADLYSIKPSFTSFLGREASLARVCALLVDPSIRLLTIHGPGGVGKTRLAREVVGPYRAQSGGSSVCLVTLTAVRDVALMLPTIATELHMRAQSTGAFLLEEILGFLRSRQQFLLILDNFEHLLSASNLIEQLLAGCPGLKVLVTSRSVLHLPGEREFLLNPLPVPEPQESSEALLNSSALQLFIQRAQARQDTFLPAPEDLPLIAQICQALDGLPLAIELAAARVKLFPLPALLDEVIDNRLDLHSPQSVDGIAGREQLTLADTITWSYDLLNAREQWFFRQLAVFPGGGSFAAAKSIWSRAPFQGPSALSLLMGLVDKNMLRPADPVHRQASFLMLETIREYGLQQLRAHDELEAAREAHAEYYLTYIQAAGEFLKGPRQASQLALLDREKQNLSATLAWLIQNQRTEQALAFSEVFGKFCGLCGYWSEEEHWLTAVLNLARTGPATALRGKVLRRAGHLAYRLRNLPTARRLLEESVAISQEVGDLSNLAGALSSLVRVLYRQRDLENTPQLRAQSLAAARASGDTWSLANTLEALANFSLLEEKPGEAARLMQEAIPLARDIGDTENLSRLLNTSVSIAIALEHLDQAVELAEESYALALAQNSKPLIALALNGLAGVAFAQKNFTRARELYEQRTHLARELSDMPTVALMQRKLGEIALAQKDFAQAEASTRESLAFFLAHGDTLNATLASQLLAEIIRQHQEE